MMRDIAVKERFGCIGQGESRGGYEGEMMRYISVKERTDVEVKERAEGDMREK